MGEVNFPTLSVWGRSWRHCDPDPGACPRVRIGGLISSLYRTGMAAFDTSGGVPEEVLYDRMKTAVIGEDEEGRAVFNNTLLDRAGH